MQKVFQMLQEIFNNNPTPLEEICYVLEGGFRTLGALPHYRWIIRPIYKMAVPQVGPVAATAAAFLASDLLVHQFAINLKTCRKAKTLEASCVLNWNPWQTAAWAALALPVMYAKYLRNRI